MSSELSTQLTNVLERARAAQAAHAAKCERAREERQAEQRLRRVDELNQERATPSKPEPEPVDAITSAGEMLRRFERGDYCTPNFHDGETTADDDRAFLIAAQIYALAHEVRRLNNTLENRP